METQQQIDRAHMLVQQLSCSDNVAYAAIGRCAKTHLPAFLTWQEQENKRPDASDTFIKATYVAYSLNGAATTLAHMFRDEPDGAGEDHVKEFLKIFWRDYYGARKLIKER